jgi:hypothetical protein
MFMYFHCIFDPLTVILNASLWSSEIELFIDMRTSHDKCMVNVVHKQEIAQYGGTSVMEVKSQA